MSNANTNDKLREVKAAIKSRMDYEQHFIDRYDEKRSEVRSKLNSADIKKQVNPYKFTAYKYESLLDMEMAYTRHMERAASILYGLEVAYDIVREALGEEIEECWE